MVQQAITDGGIVSQPYAHFAENESIYRYIEQRLDGTREAYLDADTSTRIEVLQASTTYALLTARTPLPRADAAFEIYVDEYPLPADELADRWSNVGLGLNHNKAEYVVDNHENRLDIFERADRALQNSNTVEAQDELMDISGCGPAKSSFAIACLGFTDMACADSHICRYFDIDPRSYEKHDAEQYYELIDEIFSSVPRLVEETSRFVAQWATWDLARASESSNAPDAVGDIETHDTFFRQMARYFS